MGVMIVLFLGIPIVGGMAVGLSSMKGGPDGYKAWYDRIKKAPWNPPSWVFGPAWTILYGLMGWASYIIYESGSPDMAAALAVYFVQLGVNLAWNPVFFRMRKPKIALYIIGILWALIIGTIAAFAEIDSLAAWLLAPYLAWVTFASTLNYYIVVNNEESPPTILETD